VKPSWLLIAAVLSLGLAVMFVWTWRDQTKRLAMGQWSRVQLEVVRTDYRARGNQGGLLFVRWTDPTTGLPQDGAALIGTSDVHSPAYRSGRQVQGWVHPGFGRPEVGATMPNLAPDQSFLLPAALTAAGLGLLLLLVAWKTGRWWAG
jgi:hypothetical protein